MSQLLSVIVPVFNVENYSAACIESIINQTYKPLKILLIDDGSTDRSGSICEQFALENYNIQVYHQNNNGLGLSRNRGLCLAKGKYIGFVDSDDEIEKEMYKVMIESLERDGAECACCAKLYR